MCVTLFCKILIEFYTVLSGYINAFWNKIWHPVIYLTMELFKRIVLFNLPIIFPVSVGQTSWTSTVLVLSQGYCVRYFSSFWAHVSLNDKCLWVYELWRQKATKQNQPCGVCELQRRWKEGGLMTVLSHVGVFILQYLVCKRKLESKKEALLILSKELDTCQQERDQYKLMANQLRERHQSLKKKYRELIVRITLCWCPCSLTEIERGALNMRSLLKRAESRQLPTGKTWKSSTLLPPHPVPFDTGW